MSFVRQYTPLLIWSYEIFLKNEHRSFVKLWIKWKTNKYHTVRTIPKSNIKIVKRSKIDITNTQIHDGSCSWLGTGTSIKSGWIKLVVCAQTPPLSEMMPSCTCFPHVSKMSTLTYNRANSVIIKNAIILNIIQNIFKLRDTEFVICIILVLKRADDLNHYLNIR